MCKINTIYISFFLKTKGERVAMLAKRLGAVFIMLALCVGTAFSQNRPQAGTDITVSRLFPGDAMHTSIQAAVNAAWPGAVIEILDTATYNEQVTIDGTEGSLWPGVTGGKSGITIRYVPPGNPAPNAHVAVITNRNENRATENSANSAFDFLNSIINIPFLIVV